MTIKFSLPSPRSVQVTIRSEADNQLGSAPHSDNDYTYRLLTSDGKLFSQIGDQIAIALFPQAFKAFVASGKDRLNLSDIPEPLLSEVVASLRLAGWYTKFCAHPDPLLAYACAGLPYTTAAYFIVPHLVWSSEPFPPTFEEKLWKWFKRWFV